MTRHASKIRTDRTGLRSPHCSAICRDGRRLLVKMARPLRMRDREDCRWQEYGQRPHAIVRMQARRSQRPSRSGKTNARAVESVSALYLLGQRSPTLQQSEQSRLSELWWSRHQDLRRMERELRGLSAGHASDMGAWFNNRPHRYEWPVFARELSMAAERGTVENASLARSKARRWQSEQAV